MTENHELTMIYPELVEKAMESEEPVTWRYEVGDHRVLYEAAQYDPEDETVWRAVIDTDEHPDYDTDPRVSFYRCRPTAEYEPLRDWSAIATGSLSGPKRIGPWESLFTVFNVALGAYQGRVEFDMETTYGEDEDG